MGYLLVFEIIFKMNPTSRGIILYGFAGGTPKLLSLTQGTAMEFEQLEEGNHVFSITDNHALFGKENTHVPPSKLNITSAMLGFAQSQLDIVLGAKGGAWGHGVAGNLLKIGGSRWVPGKIRFRVVMEFCPNEPEPPALPKTGLDEFRQ